MSIELERQFDLVGPLLPLRQLLDDRRVIGLMNGGKRAEVRTIRALLFAVVGAAVALWSQRRAVE